VNKQVEQGGTAGLDHNEGAVQGRPQRAKGYLLGMQTIMF